MVLQYASSNNATCAAKVMIIMDIPVEHILGKTSYCTLLNGGIRPMKKTLLSLILVFASVTSPYICAEDVALKADHLKCTGCA